MLTLSTNTLALVTVRVFVGKMRLLQLPGLQLPLSAGELMAASKTQRMCGLERTSSCTLPAHEHAPAGTVSASDNWDEPMKVKNVRPSMTGECICVRVVPDHSPSRHGVSLLAAGPLIVHLEATAPHAHGLRGGCKGSVSETVTRLLSKPMLICMKCTLHPS